MKLVTLIVLLISCIFTLVSAHPVQVTYKKWAVLLATSKGWPFYRHQANVLHAYKSLIANGFPADNIIVLTYDDIANNTKNPEKGVVRNHPNGPNVYERVPLDYTGKNVNKDTFLAVLTGNKSAVNGTGSGRTIQSERRDVILIYIVGVGAPNYLTFPYGLGIPADVFVNTLTSIQKTRKSRKILLLLETSYAASLVETLPRKRGILAVTAGGSREVPRAVFCYRERNICYGSIFGVAWAEHLDRIRQLRSGAEETIFNHFQYLRTHTVGSHVGLYGHVEIGRGKGSEFFDYKLVLKDFGNRTHHPHDSLATAKKLDYALDHDDVDDDFEIEYNDVEDNRETNEHDARFSKNIGSELQSKRKTEEAAASDNEIPLLADEDQLTGIITEKRTIVDVTLDEIVKNLSAGKNIGLSSDDFGDIKNIKKTEHLDCYHRSVENFHKKCFDINENTYSLRHLHKLANLCALNVDHETIAEAMESVCTDVHRNYVGVH